MKILNRVLPLILILNGIVLFPSLAQEQRGFTIEGKVNGLEKGMNVYLLLEKDTIAKTIAGNEGAFSFKGYVADEINSYKLVLDTQLSKIACPFLLTNAKIKLASYIEDWPGIKIAGSTVNAEYRQVLKNIKESTSSGKPNLSPEKWAEMKSTYRKSLIAPLAIKDLVYNRLIEPAVGMEFFNSLDGFIKKSTYGLEADKYLKAVIHTFTIAEQIKPAALLPDFMITNPEGKRISVLEAARKNKITLIDFWASWCGPCRAEVPNMKKVYDQFKDKGFGIIGVSSDAKIEDWKKALKEDQTMWLHGINQEQIAYQKFDIQTIPAFILVDDQGKLLSFSCERSIVKRFGLPIRGEELTKTIEALLK